MQAPAREDEDSQRDELDAQADEDNYLAQALRRRGAACGEDGADELGEDCGDVGEDVEPHRGAGAEAVGWLVGNGRLVTGGRGKK